VLYPNPFDPDKTVRGTLKVIGMPAGSTLNIYTVSGEMVKRQQAGNGFNGWTEWDCRSDWGDIAATGVYYYVIRLDDRTLAKGALVIRRGN
jgi:hypothetical protein